jgi:hypothetical protein
VALAVTLAACGGGRHDGGTPSAVPNDGAVGGNETVQCRAGGQVVVTVFFDGPGDRFYGVHTRLRYPTSLAIPGHRDDPSVVERVRFVVALPLGREDVPEETFRNGSTVLNDEDSDFDGVDDGLQAVLVAREAFADGKYIDVTFDCVDTIEWPTADAFGCEVAELTDLTSNPAQGTCSVVVEPPET